MARTMTETATIHDVVQVLKKYEQGSDERQAARALMESLSLLKASKGGLTRKKRETTGATAKKDNKSGQNNTPTKENLHLTGVAKNSAGVQKKRGRGKKKPAKKSH